MPNSRTTTGLPPGVFAGATDTSARFCSTSQPRTSTSGTWSAAVTVARNDTRLTPRSTSWSRTRARDSRIIACSCAISGTSPAAIASAASSWREER